MQLCIFKFLPKPCYSSDKTLCCLEYLIPLKLSSHSRRWKLRLGCRALKHFGILFLLFRIVPTPFFWVRCLQKMHTNLIKFIQKRKAEVRPHAFSPILPLSINTPLIWISAVNEQNQVTSSNEAILFKSISKLAGNNLHQAFSSTCIMEEFEDYLNKIAFEINPQICCYSSLYWSYLFFSEGLSFSDKKIM